MIPRCYTQTELFKEISESMFTTVFLSLTAMSSGGFELLILNKHKMNKEEQNLNEPQNPQS